MKSGCDHREASLEMTRKKRQKGWEKSAYRFVWSMCCVIRHMQIPSKRGPKFGLALMNPHFPGSSVVKNLPANTGDTSSVPGQEDRLEEGMETHSSILAWRIPWTEDPGGLQSTGSQSWTRLSSHTCAYTQPRQSHLLLIVTKNKEL